MGTYEWIISKELGDFRTQFVARLRAANTGEASRLAIEKYPELISEKLHISIVSSSFRKN
jgi:hypothetical protein